MTINFINVPDRLAYGLELVCETMAIMRGTGLDVTAECGGEGLRVTRGESGFVIRFSEDYLFFRGIGHVLENLSEEKVEICEKPVFESNGIMIDMSQSNAVMRPEALKRYMSHMALMGLNRFYLYIEDGYYVEDNPYFGYMRSRYTKDELHELCRAADSLGMMIIPCIQTLAHLMDVLKWEPYEGMRENDHTLLVGEERVYTLIRKMLESIVECFPHKQIHIGMDEAWQLGQGNYLIKHGFKPTYEIMNEHMTRVMEIVRELGISPMIWSDMYIKAAAGLGANPDEAYYRLADGMPQEIIDIAPRDMTYVYWDYNHHDVSKYLKIIARHKLLSDNVIFAGGIWNWTSYGVDYDKTFLTSIPALTACRKAGLKNIFATTWGDGGVESCIFQSLLGAQLYAEYTYHETVSNETLAKRFFACTGCNMKDFYDMTYLDNYVGQIPEEGYCYTNTSRAAMWQDVFCGLFDKNFADYPQFTEQYEKLYLQMNDAILRNGAYGYVFKFLANALDVLQDKFDIGIRLKEAYDRRDMHDLQALTCKLEGLSAKINTLRGSHRDWWYKINKPFGFEIMDLRYGASLARVDTCVLRLKEFTSGTISVLEELEEERLYFGAQPGLIKGAWYSKMPSASRISISHGW